jgi:hypothetical protein
VPSAWIFFAIENIAAEESIFSFDLLVKKSTQLTFASTFAELFIWFSFKLIKVPVNSFLSCGNNGSDTIGKTY